jgi:DNA-binding beta-propeller fold protein YncE
MKGIAMSRPMLIAAALVLATQVQAAPLQVRHVMNIGVEGRGEGQFKYVEDFAFSKDGHLLVTDASHAYVQAFDKISGKFIAHFGGKGDNRDNLEKPEGIAVDPAGNVFVADYTSGNIKKYDPSFKWLKTFSGYGSNPGQTKQAEFMDIRDGRLYVPDAGNNRINVFDLDGKPLFDFGGPGSEPGKLNAPEAAKFSSDGKLYVSDLKNDRIQVFDPQGKFLFAFGKSGSAPGELKAPSGIAFDRDDNVYVNEIGNHRVQVFDKAGKYIAGWGSEGSGEGQFLNLHGIAVDKQSGVIYVADTGNHRVQVFAPVTPKTVDAVTR